ncbi:hypothetical protein SALB1_2542 [Salinisphaera sp. LB1]|nr:hypothetical protein SALB1_2542 [Salinisphaera sp. LB1]
MLQTVAQTYFMGADKDCNGPPVRAGTTADTGPAMLLTRAG